MDTRLSQKLFFLLIICGMLLPALLRSQGGHTYVGAEKCKKCHSDYSIGNQYGIWLSSPHARAKQTLSSEKALRIAGNHSVKNPAESRFCLRCHTTGGGSSPLTMDEGVGCEACHGAASGYYTAGNHVNLLYRDRGYATAVKNGMYPIRGIDSLKKRERLCMSCHTDKRPCVPEDRENRKRRGISLQVIDKLRKGSIDISHPLRRY